MSSANFKLKRIASASRGFLAAARLSCSHCRWLFFVSVACDSSIKVLGVTISNNLSMAGHVSPLLDTCARTLYGLRVLRAHGLHQDCLDEVFQCIVLAKLLYASPAWSGFCSAADNGKLDRFLNRCRKLYCCQQLNPDISELFSLADQSLFSSLQKNSHHILQRLLPAKSTQPYNLRPHRHSFSLTQKQSSYDDCNFITRMLFLRYVLTELFLSVTAYIIVPLCGVSYMIIKRI